MKQLRRISEKTLYGSRDRGKKQKTLIIKNRIFNKIMKISKIKIQKKERVFISFYQAETERII